MNSSRDILRRRSEVLRDDAEQLMNSAEEFKKDCYALENSDSRFNVLQMCALKARISAWTAMRMYEECMKELTQDERF